MSTRIPITEPSSKDTSVAAPAQPVLQRRSLPESLTVLVVDDNAEVRAMICAMLGEAGCSAVQANGPRHACELLDQCQFDAVVIDLVMPAVHGLEVLCDIRTRTFGRDVPAVILSVLPEGETRQTVRGLVRALGSAEAIDKPVTHDRLMAALHRVVRAT